MSCAAQFITQLRLAFQWNLDFGSDEYLMGQDVLYSPSLSLKLGHFSTMLKSMLYKVAMQM